MADVLTTRRGWGGLLCRLRDMGDTTHAEVFSTANNLEFTPITITAGQSLSAAVDIGPGRVIVGIVPPASGWTTASVTFQAATSLAGTYGNVTDEGGAELVLANKVAGNYRTVGSLVPNFRAMRFVKVRSGTAATPVAQASGATLTLITASM